MSIWPFKKKYPPKDHLKFDGKWAILQGVVEGHPAILTRRDLKELKDIIGHPEFPYQVGIATPCNNPDSNGFPGKDELIQLQQIEHRITPLLQQNNESILVAMLTTNNMRELIYYTSNPEGVKAKFEQLKAETTTHELQMIIQVDKDWSIFKHFAM